MTFLSNVPKPAPNLAVAKEGLAETDLKFQNEIVGSLRGLPKQQASSGKLDVCVAVEPRHSQIGAMRHGFVVRCMQSREYQSHEEVKYFNLTYEK